MMTDAVVVDAVVVAEGSGDRTWATSRRRRWSIVAAALD